MLLHAFEKVDDKTMQNPASAVKRLLNISCLGFCLLATACLTLPPNAAVQPQPTCVPATPEANPYLNHTQEGPVKIFELLRAGSITLENARQAAFSQLGINTGRWSDDVDIVLDGNNMVRITVTYLDPALIQYIVLNQTLATSNMSLEEFKAELGKRMIQLGGRNEMLFIVTITASSYQEQAFNSNVLNVRIPIEEMALINASDVRVTPVHEDHILDELINISHGPVHGIVGFPFGITNGGGCIWIVDQYTSSLTLDVPKVLLGDIDIGPQYWNIPYRPLVMEVNNFSVAAYDQSFDWSRLTKIETPPRPTWRPNAQFDDANWKLYWEDMGRFIWNVVIMESHH